MGENLKKAYSEVCSLINLLDDDYRNKIPVKLIKFFEKEKLFTYIPDINPDIPLEEQDLQQNTIDILAMLKLHYWCSNKNEKEKLLKLLNDNERKYQDELRKKV